MKPLISVGALCAISKDQLIGFKMRDGANNRISFLNFIIEILGHLKAYENDNYNKVIFYLDNATYHTTPLLLEAF